MPNALDARITDEAIAWRLRLAQGRDEDWPTFVQWLEADVRHNDAYEAVADQDSALPRLLEAADFPAAAEEAQDLSAQPLQPSRGTASLWRWGALAASAVLVTFVSVQLLSGPDAHYSIETPAGESRTIALADGSKIMLNGNSQVTFDRSEPRMARLDRGEARFAVEHDASAPFTVNVGEARLVDVGTVFNVVRSGAETRVGVSEGAVRFEGATRKVDLAAGDTLAINAAGAITVATAPTAAIGGWAEGVLVYEAVPLRIVAEDLSRNLGVSLVLPAATGARPFSGVIQTDGGAQAVRARLEELLDARIAVEGSSWTVVEQ